MGWYTRDDLLAMGMQQVGHGVQVSTGVRLYRPEHMSIGDYSRIDDAAMLTAGPGGSITLGRHVYVGPACIIESPEETTLGDYSTLAARVTLYGATDNYDGEFLTNPTVPPELRDESTEPIRLGRHSIVGTHSVVLPGGRIGQGSAVGAMSLVNQPLGDFGMFAGTPVRRIGDRSRRVLELEPQRPD